MVAQALLGVAGFSSLHMLLIKLRELEFIAA